MSSSSNTFETWGNPTNMNLNELVYVNIQSSPYFKALYEKKTYHEVVDEIYNNVDTLAEPFMKGTTASSAFCLLYKLWTLKLTVRQLTGMLNHTDSPHIRALGMLYIRYICKPANMWDWLVDYLEDEEEVQVRGGRDPMSMTIGQLCRALLTQQKWCNTMLPRIPVPIARDINEKLSAYMAEHGLTADQPAPATTATEQRHAANRDGRWRERSPRRGGRDRSRSTDRYRRRGYRSDSRDRYSRDRRNSSRDRHARYGRDDGDDRSHRGRRDDRDRRDDYYRRDDRRDYDRRRRPASRSRSRSQERR
ncbi:PRP38 family-domain-containing protein [Thamnocephalis sphaerospora]|uniref:Pre-mRNA-splicing factor 38 n=1 Tax=Thamnocephalis sphaerospora TaxID=78915 RepID=A0A4P9XTB7_9FUNG|nr:PRP38 family-domain-containing protein [Thamnocephalis sphaerospora]|eukprot:RKP09393.1 PRP38 family-domain-containing protein [Thamnocephalis sphaerospora]